MGASCVTGTVRWRASSSRRTPRRRKPPCTECNSGFYCFDSQALFQALDQVSSNNAQGEFYLTDVLEICRTAGRSVLALRCDDPDECLGVNSRIQLAEAAKHLQRRINQAHMAAGVTMTDPDQVWIGPDVAIEQDVELLPQTFLLGTTRVGEDSVVGPNSRLTDTVVGRGCVVDETVAVEACIDDGATCGPRAYLRPGAHLCEGAKAGTHVEIKKSTVGKGSKVPHLSYIGDCTIGEGVNIGAGSITCNYDGVHKHATTIGRRRLRGQRHHAGGAGERGRRMPWWAPVPPSRATSPQERSAWAAPARPKSPTGPPSTSARRRGREGGVPLVQDARIGRGGVRAGHSRLRAKGPEARAFCGRSGSPLRPFRSSIQLPAFAAGLPICNNMR